MNKIKDYYTIRLPAENYLASGVGLKNQIVLLFSNPEGIGFMVE